jgi:microcystin-dependent protein
MDGFNPPAAGVFDAPAVSVALNVEWRSFILGVLTKLITPPAFGIGNADVFMWHADPIWSGDDDSQFLADQEIEKLISALASGQGLVMIPVGSTQSYIGTEAPDGWLMCNGDGYLKSSYPELWGVLSLHGTRFESRFNSAYFILPDLRGRVIVGAGTDSSTTDRIVGDIGGSETNALTAENIPAHHAGATAAFDAGEESVEITYFTGDTNPPEPPYSELSGQSESLPFSIMPPFFALNYIIKT